MAEDPENLADAIDSINLRESTLTSARNTARKAMEMRVHPFFRHPVRTIGYDSSPRTPLGICFSDTGAPISISAAVLESEPLLGELAIYVETVLESSGQVIERVVGTLGREPMLMGGRATCAGETSSDFFVLLADGATLLSFSINAESLGMLPAPRCMLPPRLQHPRKILRGNQNYAVLCSDNRLRFLGGTESYDAADTEYSCVGTVHGLEDALIAANIDAQTLDLYEISSGKCILSIPYGAPLVWTMTDTMTLEEFQCYREDAPRFIAAWSASNNTDALHIAWLAVCREHYHAFLPPHGQAAVHGRYQGGEVVAAVLNDAMNVLVTVQESGELRMFDPRGTKRQEVRIKSVSELPACRGGSSEIVCSDAESAIAILHASGRLRVSFFA